MRKQKDRQTPKERKKEKEREEEGEDEMKKTKTEHVKKEEKKEMKMESTKKRKDKEKERKKRRRREDNRKKRERRQRRREGRLLGTISSVCLYVCLSLTCSFFSLLLPLMLLSAEMRKKRRSANLISGPREAGSAEGKGRETRQGNETGTERQQAESKEKMCGLLFSLRAIANTESCRESEGATRQGGRTGTDQKAEVARYWAAERLKATQRANNE